MGLGLGLGLFVDEARVERAGHSPLHGSSLDVPLVRWSVVVVVVVVVVVLVVLVVTPGTGPVV